MKNDVTGLQILNRETKDIKFNRAHVGGSTGVHHLGRLLRLVKAQMIQHCDEATHEENCSGTMAVLASDDDPSRHSAGRRHALTQQDP